ncbi:hypothetical protein E6P09_05335 [Haloferax mediterranei ATCC 33500]|uniref:Uncharacterized protein n=1 Tax=Haloferax mediterranei (strain ATCC 33500 / DSM 1411 / JCM 8866 / NBRC 14739 / NCIMB 2177 / R-4) TaxID=523841 RepID=I3R1S9_HALMT|nr:hypothetical protein [Haloferax mediterranei]AFK18189.1 hypothetical protein HFX_0454 [Haloferax mediterranei ATCC 33500]AHZ22404.1 hypothetical protein BM92_06985 [Haloferax mediterranei ATCC 33500]EMA02537.1 hypothetical protein C439_08140 [Haloferax mediterranei ATCC 33500]MDX5988279.1 hypothetical protein [Haloferax mediterranei ATCC 33500]QCQ74717.1 hypothetical protein E6P09_05335 [Haloferax mediterranei ATCC 33500]
MSSPSSTQDLGDLFVSLTGQTTLTEHRDATSSVVELRPEDTELMADVASTVRETGMEDTLAHPEVD